MTLTLTVLGSLIPACALGGSNATCAFPVILWDRDCGHVAEFLFGSFRCRYAVVCVGRLVLGLGVGAARSTPSSLVFWLYRLDGDETLSTTAHLCKLHLNAGGIYPLSAVSSAEGCEVEFGLTHEHALSRLLQDVARNRQHEGSMWGRPGAG